RFADGSVLDESAVRLALAVPAATASHDTIFGSDRGETLLGLVGEDTLYGEGGDDVLDGGTGSDYLIGGEGDDTYFVDHRLDRVTERAGEGEDTVIATASYGLPAEMENLVLTGAAANGTGNDIDNVIDGNSTLNQLRGARGDDLLRGGTGNDLYLYDLGDGNDTIEDLDATPGNLDELRFGPGIAGADVRVARIEDDLRLRLRGGGEVLLAGWYDPASRVELVRFADGTSWDAAMLEHLASLPSNEPPQLAQPIADVSVLEDVAFERVLQPGTFVDADAANTLVYEATQGDGAPLPTWLQFDEAGGAFPVFSGTPANEDVGEYTIRVTATDPAGESASDEFVLTVVNVNDAPGLQAPLADQAVAAGAAFALTLDEAMFADVDAGDALAYHASRADGEALPAWLAFDAATKTFSGTPAATDAGALDVRVTATDLAGAQASDEFRITVTDGAPGDGHIVGTDRADVLIGTPDDDVIDGRRGHDFLVGLKGDDAYLYRRGDGHDWILEAGGMDTLRFGEGIAESDVAVLRRHGDLVLKVQGDGGSVTVKNWFLAAGKRVERVEFADGAAWDEGGLRARARHWHDDGGFDGHGSSHGHGHHHGHDHDWPRWAGAHGRGTGRDEDRRGFHDARDAIEARLKRAPRYDFSALAEQLRGERKGGASGVAENARRWDAIRQAVGLLALAEDDAARGWDRGGDDEHVAHANAAHGWGHAGSTGRHAGFAGLRAFAGLGEGFRSLG
ncbi:MAG TPA: putative Ig domain-containing protein, partial [Candidatus Thermoplasmatota archaeon]|nr:putative Ig domain-containing protein [Candidatus Thermoplasmatota archaeon]